jgi:hypothetical protein
VLLSCVALVVEIPPSSGGQVIGECGRCEEGKVREDKAIGNVMVNVREDKAIGNVRVNVSEDK